MATLRCGTTDLPEPAELSTTDEIIWSANAGRSSETGKMIGDVIAKKKTLNITWKMLTAAQASLIYSKLPAGFFSITFNDYGTSTTITGYRGNIEKESLGYIGDGVYYYKSLKVSVIQQ